MNLFPPGVYVNETGTSKGRGVFAAKPFACGDVVETAPVVVIPAVDGTPLEIDRLVFNWAVLAGEPGTSALALGYGSLYNHASVANMRYEADTNHLILRFIAVRGIAVDEELTVNYNAIGGGPEWPDDNWFDRKGVARIGGT